MSQYGVLPPDKVEEPAEEELTPIGTMVLTVAYIVIFAAAWGLVYFTELLARR